MLSGQDGLHVVRQVSSTTWRCRMTISFSKLIAGAGYRQGVTTACVVVALFAWSWTPQLALVTSARRDTPAMTLCARDDDTLGSLFCVRFTRIYPSSLNY